MSCQWDKQSMAVQGLCMQESGVPGHLPKQLVYTESKLVPDP
ncbi:hypothetical protein GGP60_003128 [Salinibacter ruber]|nr:hypothetical protein [Salinibacter ruber]